MIRRAERSQSRRNHRTVAWIWLAGAIVYLVSEAIAAARFRGYSYVDDYISDLGVSGVMNYGAFMIHGCLFLLGALAVTRASPGLGWAGRSFVIAATANAVGNILVATFRSGLHGHVIGAGLAIIGGNIAVIIAGVSGRRVGAPQTYRIASIALGVLGIACLLVLIVDGVNGSRALPVGVIERGAVYTIIAWELVTAVGLLGVKRGRCSRR